MLAPKLNGLMKEKKYIKQQITSLSQLLPNFYTFVLLGLIQIIKRILTNQQRR